MKKPSFQTQNFPQSNSPFGILIPLRKRLIALSFVALFCLSAMFPFSGSKTAFPFNNPLINSASASSVYHNMASGNLAFNLTNANVNMVTTNDDWSGIPSIEGYEGTNLAAEGVDPQTVLGTEFASNALPSTLNTQVNANKGNPSAYNAGGITEFDTGTYISLGMQGTGTADNPYIVMYLNTTGRSTVTISYNVTDIDGGSNNAVSPVALQYRVGEAGLFTNIPSAFVADATTAGAGNTVAVSATLPAICNNKPKVQVRIITNNEAGQGEWIGINNFIASSVAPTASNASVSGRVFGYTGNPVSRASVQLYDSLGNVRTAQTNSFGYYNFTELPVGELYILEVRSKRYVFTNPTQTVTLNNDLQDVNFYSEDFSNIFNGHSVKNYK